MTDRWEVGVLQTAVVAAVATLVVELAFVADLVDAFEVGHIAVSPASIPAAVVGALLIPQLVGRPLRPRFAVAFWLAAASAFAVLAAVYASRSYDPVIGGITVAAFGEELVYRLAVPFALAVVAHRLGIPPREAVWIGLGLSAAWFVVLPGHVAQMHQPLDAVPFAGYALLAAWVVARSGAVLALGLVHAATNLASLLVTQGTSTISARGLLVAGVLGLLVAAYAGRQPEPRDDRPSTPVQVLAGARGPD